MTSPKPNYLPEAPCIVHHIEARASARDLVAGRGVEGGNTTQSIETPEAGQFTAPKVEVGKLRLREGQ